MLLEAAPVFTGLLKAILGMACIFLVGVIASFFYSWTMAIVSQATLKAVSYTHLEQGGTNVSGGQRQRLCIARALLRKPKILILDDSTSAVDMKTDAMIRKAFAEEIPDTTKIIIAQRVASVQEADKIIVLDDGKIVAVGNHEELLATNDIYQEVYYSQNKNAIAAGGEA